MKAGRTVSSAQFFCLLFVCKIIALFTFVISDPAQFPAGDRTVVFLPFLLEGALTAVPVMLTMGPEEDRTLFTLTDGLHPALSGICALLYAGGAVWSAAASAARFELFMSTVMFSGADPVLLTALLLAAAVYAARMGHEAVGRMSVPVLALIAASLIYVGVTTAGEFEAANLEAPLQNGVLPLLTNSFLALTRTGETAALLVFAPRIRGGIKKGLTLWFAAYGLTASIVFTLILGTTGAYGERQMFRLYTLTVLSRIGVFERMDALITAIWVLCALIRLAFFLQAGAVFLARGNTDGIKTGRLIMLAVPVFAVYLILSRRVALFSAVIRSGANAVIYCLMLIVLPSAVLIADKIKHAKRRAIA